jgi:hypothetical protein
MSILENNNLFKTMKMCINHKSGPSPSLVYCILAQLTNSNVLGKSPIRDLGKLEIAIGGFGKNTIHT